MKHTISYLKNQLDARAGSPNPNTIYRLGKLATPSATTILLDLLDSPGITHESIQYILAALRYTGDQRANEALLKFFNNGFETSTVVINSLGHLRESKAVPKMIDLLGNAPSTLLDHHSAMSLRFRVTIALGNIGDERAIPILKQCLGDYKTTLRYALSDVQLQVPLCEYAHDALLKIGTPQACGIAAQWAEDYDVKLQQEALILQERVMVDQNFVDLQGDLIRLKHHAIPVLESMSEAQLKQYPSITYNVLKEFAKQDTRLTDETHYRIKDFIMEILQNRGKHLSLEQGFMLLDHYDDPRAIEFALSIFSRPDFHPDIHGDPLGLLTKKCVKQAIPIIAEKIKHEGISERFLTSLGMIGGQQAEEIVLHYLNSKHGQIKMSAIYALADLARESDTALEAMSQLIDTHDYSISQQAIIRMDKVGKRGVFILLNLLGSYDKWSSSRALATLARIGDTRIIPHLITLLSDSNYSYLHRDIVTTLEKLESEPAYEIVNLWRSNSP